MGNSAGMGVTGNENTAAGVLAGVTVNGSQNSAFGSNAGRNVTGSQNVAVGVSAGNSVSATNTIAIGTLSKPTKNFAAAIGANSQATGLSAAAVGGGSSAATAAQATGDFSAAFGAAAVAVGNSSLALGRGSGAWATGAVAIGYGSYTNVANTVSVGTASRSAAHHQRRQRRQSSRQSRPGAGADRGSRIFGCRRSDQFVAGTRPAMLTGLAGLRRGPRAAPTEIAGAMDRATTPDTRSGMDDLAPSTIVAWANVNADGTLSAQRNVVQKAGTGSACTRWCSRKVAEELHSHGDARNERDDRGLAGNAGQQPEGRGPQLSRRGHGRRFQPGGHLLIRLSATPPKCLTLGLRRRSRCPACAPVVVGAAQPFEVDDFVAFELGAEGDEIEGQQIGRC